MVLNLLRVEEINPEYMLEKSFYQFQHYRALPGVVESKHTSVLTTARRGPDELVTVLHKLSALMFASRCGLHCGKKCPVRHSCVLCVDET